MNSLTSACEFILEDGAHVGTQCGRAGFEICTRRGIPVCWEHSDQSAGQTSHAWLQSLFLGNWGLYLVDHSRFGAAHRLHVYAKRYETVLFRRAGARVETCDVCGEPAAMLLSSRPIPAVVFATEDLNQAKVMFKLYEGFIENIGPRLNLAGTGGRR